MGSLGFSAGLLSTGFEDGYTGFSSGLPVSLDIFSSIRLDVVYPAFSFVFVGSVSAGLAVGSYGFYEVSVGLVLTGLAIGSAGFYVVSVGLISVGSGDV